jgi:hypothetical protein
MLHLSRKCRRKIKHCPKKAHKEGVNKHEIFTLTSNKQL